jgi:DNA-binding transcriptional ArsR family regulator
MSPKPREIEVIDERARAESLLHPLRLRVLEAARQPASATEIARRLKLSPQKVNYHVRRLEEHGFLEMVEERRARNLVEKIYQATAESYVLASQVLGGLSPRAALADVVSVSHWLGLQARAEAELGEVLRASSGEGQKAATLSMDAEFRFESAEQRAVFARALREIVTAIVAKYTSPARTAEGEPGAGRPYRLILGCYPLPERGISRSEAEEAA